MDRDATFLLALILFAAAHPEVVEER